MFDKNSAIIDIVALVKCYDKMTVEEQFKKVVSLLKTTHPNYFPIPAGQENDPLALQPDDAMMIAIKTLMNKFYPQYVNTKDKNSAIILLPSANPAIQMPTPIIDLEVKGNIAVNMDDQSISSDIPKGHIRTPGVHIPSDSVIQMQPPKQQQANVNVAGIPVTAQLAPQPPVPVHRIDEPMQQFAPTKPVGGVSDVIMDLSMIHVPVSQGTMKQVPEFIQKTMKSVPMPAGNVVKNMYDNSITIQKYPKAHLRDIEKVANTYGCSVYMSEWPNYGVIMVMTYEGFKPVPCKCFVIDSGVIIDRRTKVIKHDFVQGGVLEMDPMFELFTGVNSGSGKIIDNALLKTIFEVGVDGISKKEMYPAEKKELNLKVDLSSIPAEGISIKQRKLVEEYLIQMNRNGYFDQARKYSPGARFMFIPHTKLNPKDLTSFTLINEGVPMYYGGPIPQQVPLIITSKGGEVQIHASGQN